MIIEEIPFRSLIAITSSPVPTTIHRYKNAYFGLSTIGKILYIAIAKDGPKEKVSYIEYDINTREWRAVDPTKEKFSRDPRTVVIPVIEVKKLWGKIGEQIRSILGG